MSRPGGFDDSTANCRRDMCGSAERHGPSGAARSGAVAIRRQQTACRHADRRHGRTRKGRRARMGMAGQGDDESRHAAAALQPRQGAAAAGQADHQLHHFELQSRAVLRSRQALRLHLVRDAAQHDVLRRGAADDGGVPRCRRRADDPHARRAGVEHPEGHRSRRPRDHRPDRGRCTRSAGCGAVLALSAVWTPQRRRRGVPRPVEPAGVELSRDDQRQHAGHGDDRDARRRGDGQRDRRDPRRGRRHHRQQRPVEFLRAGARTIRATRTPSSRCTTRRSSTASTTATPANST